MKPYRKHFERSNAGKIFIKLNDPDSEHLPVLLPVMLKLPHVNFDIDAIAANIYEEVGTPIRS